MSSRTAWKCILEAFHAVAASYPDDDDDDDESVTPLVAVVVAFVIVVVVHRLRDDIRRLTSPRRGSYSSPTVARDRVPTSTPAHPNPSL
jgi:hypothetical protein